MTNGHATTRHQRAPARGESRTDGSARHHELCAEYGWALRGLQFQYLRAGDRLPTVKEVAVDLAINPNTVVKAYRQLEHEGLTTGRPGQGTFITASPVPPAAEQVPSAATGELRRSLDRWLRDAVAAGLSEETITALIAAARRDAATTAVRAAGPAGAVGERAG
jgi:GntR family transcriptional regulator